MVDGVRQFLIKYDALGSCDTGFSACETEEGSISAFRFFALDRLFGGRYSVYEWGI